MTNNNHSTTNNIFKHLTDIQLANLKKWQQKET